MMYGKAMISADMKQMNRKVVFDIVRKKRAVTRGELSEITGMSGPSIMAIVNEFVEKGILTITGKKDGTAGRSPVTMEFNPDVLMAVGIEFEGNNLSAGLVNLDGDIRFQTMVKAPANLGESFFEALGRSIDKLAAMAQKEGFAYKGIGFGIPGAVDGEKKIVHFAPYVGVTSPVDLSGAIRELEERYHVPVFIENDVNACAAGEYYIRRMKEEIPDLIYLSMGTGLGAGLILDGKLRHGGRGLCGEIGYSCKSVKDVVSRGQTGWLEQMLSTETLNREFAAYRDSCRVDEGMAGYIADILCPVIANLANTLDVDLVVVGGQLMVDGGSLLLQTIQEQVRKLALSEVKVQNAASDYAGVVGSALVASGNLWKTILS